MNLKYELPKKERKLLSLTSGESIQYCSPYDISLEGGFCQDGYIVITEKRLIVLQEGSVVNDIILGNCSDIRCESLVNNGILVVVRDEVEEIIARFSMKHVARIAYIARGALGLSKGNTELVVSRELERTCPKCNRAMLTAYCLHCGNKFMTFKRFWKLVGKFQGRLLLTSLFMVLASMINLWIPEVQQKFIDESLVDKSGSLSDVFAFIGVMAALTTVLLIINLIRNWWCATLGAGISMELRKVLYEKVQTLSLSVMSKRKPGELMNRIAWDTSHIRMFMEHVFSNMISTLFTMVGAFVAMLVMQPTLTLIATIFIVVAFSINSTFNRVIRKIFRMQGRKGDKINASLQDVISGIRVVKSFGKEKMEAEQFNLKVEDYARVQKKNEVLWAYCYPMVLFVMGIGTYVATYIGGLDVLEGVMTKGELVQYITYTGILYGPLGWMNQIPRMFRRMVVALERIYDVLDEESDLVEHESAKKIDIKGEVEFRAVGFGYKTYEPVLTDINLKVAAGEMIGLVGSSGTGKSTMINLLMRLYDVDQGAIYIDGVDIREIDSDCLHSQLGVVLQETFLFSGTILNNLRYAKPDATMEEIIRAAKAANAHDFISKMPDGYNTYIGERGFTVSGGERQRIAIARAILNNPKLLILDEATASLDTESEYLIQQALNRLREGRTTFAIAHRLSTLKEADRLVVIDGHKIAEMGTHNELMERQGIYYRLVNAQLEMQKVVKEA